MRDLFRGTLVRLTGIDPEAMAKTEVRWQRDSEFFRLANADPAVMFSEAKLKELFGQRFGEGFNPTRYPFSIRALEDDRLIGFIGMGLKLSHGEAWIGILIGERELWGKGYGTDAMKLCLQYAFTELNVHRVSLGVHEYNPRALKSYEKAGFRLEGRSRQDLLREGRRYDSLWMGILREEWIGLDTGNVVE